MVFIEPPESAPPMDDVTTWESSEPINTAHEKAEMVKESVPIATVSVIAAGNGFALIIDNPDLPDETLADLMRGAADKLEGKDDRSKGLW